MKKKLIFSLVFAILTSRPLERWARKRADQYVERKTK
jgi:hypothetical protein